MVLQQNERAKKDPSWTMAKLSEGIYTGVLVKFLV
jgi:hypothetical protein